MSDVEQSKSEQATPYKLRRAREKGTVARGLDLGFLAAIGAFGAYVWIEAPNLAAALALTARRALVAAPQVDAGGGVLAVTGSMASAAGRSLAMLVATVFAAVLVVEVVQTGLVFSTEPLKPDFSRLSPANAFKRVFSVRMLIETAKNLLKLVVYGALAYVVLRHAQIIDLTSIVDAQSLGRDMLGTAKRLLAFFIAGAGFFAVVDQLIVRQDFARRMRMSPREVRREARDREGDPRIKQRRQRLHREFAKLSQSLRNVRGADMLITNPTHVAVALRYDPKTMAAPSAVSLGAHQFAQRLKKLAFIYGLVIIENPSLARGLYQYCELNQLIPEQYYRAVADIYLSIRQNQARRRGTAAHV